MLQKSAKELVAEASKQIETLAADDAVKLADDPNVVFVDVREGDELQKTGKLEDAVHVPRGFLEFQADPSSPTHKPELGGGKLSLPLNRLSTRTGQWGSFYAASRS